MAGGVLHGGNRKLQCGATLLSLFAVALVVSYFVAVNNASDDMILKSDVLEEKILDDSAQQSMNERLTRSADRSKHAAQWDSKQQKAYDKAVAHARSVERDGHTVYQPLRMPRGYVHEAEIEQEAFEEQLIDMTKRLEPAYLAEALDWAESDDTRENEVLSPIVHSLEMPIIKDLDMEARTRVEDAVEAISKRHNLGLPEKEQLRAHLMAPLLLRIRARVHSQVSHYVVKMARDVVLKAENSSNPVMQQIVGQLHKHQSSGLRTVPRLRDGDLKMVNALHDLDSIYKSHVINKKDYNTQKAKLLSDWLKYSVNKAGGNANEVLRIVFGGDVRGVTDTGIKNPSPISVHKKLAMEKGVASLIKDRNVRLNSDLVYHLIHSKAQWGAITGCDKEFSSPRCAAKWTEIKDLVQQYAGNDDTDVNWGETAPSPSKRASVAKRDVEAHHPQALTQSVRAVASAQDKQEGLKQADSKSKGFWSWI